MGPHKSINDTTATGWYGMNMADIRRIEEETKAVLDKERATGEKRGHEEAKEQITKTINYIAIIILVFISSSNKCSNVRTLIAILPSREIFSLSYHVINGNNQFKLIKGLCLNINPNGIAII